MSSKSPPKTTQSREDRLKAALKQNLGRRKSQARAKAIKLADEQVVQENDAAASKKPGSPAQEQKE
ncbi:MAG: hypothetical protein OSA51_13680 [Octadecabacter sp.]|nr:hypothetical protein [Octadecabacter sp.]